MQTTYQCSFFLTGKDLEERKIGHRNVHVVAVYDSNLATAEPEKGVAQSLTLVQFECVGIAANYLVDPSHPGSGQGHVVMATLSQPNQRQIHVYCTFKALTILFQHGNQSTI